MSSKHLLLCCPHLLLPSIFPRIRVFYEESALRIRWPKYQSSSLSISPSNEHPGLISFRMDWLDLLTVQGTLKTLLQHHSSNASILRRSAFFTVQLSHPYMTQEASNLRGPLSLSQWELWPRHWAPVVTACLPQVLYSLVYFSLQKKRGFPGGSVVNNLPANTRDMGSIPGPGRSLGVGGGDPLQYSCLENPGTEEPGMLYSP